MLALRLSLASLLPSTSKDDRRRQEVDVWEIVTLLAVAALLVGLATALRWVRDQDVPIL